MQEKLQELQAKLSHEESGKKGLAQDKKSLEEVRRYFEKVQCFVSKKI